MLLGLFGLSPAAVVGEGEGSERSVPGLIRAVGVVVVDRVVRVWRVVAEGIIGVVLVVVDVAVTVR
jgi:hypothetical protein